MGAISWLSTLAAPLLLIVFFKTVIASISFRQKNAPYPPGPKPKPIIGNMLDLRIIKEHGPEYAEWGKKYKSDILFATAFGNHVLILNKQVDADELFERRAKLYSDRPQIPMINLVGWERIVSLMPYGHYWRYCRKISQQHFNYESAKKYRPVIQEKVYRFLAGLLESPDKLASHNKMLSVSFTLAIMYGYEVTSIDDPFIAAADQNTAIVGGLLTPEASIINLLPFLGYIPPWLAGPMTSRKAAAEAQKLTKFMQQSMWDFVQESIKNGTAVSSLVTDSMEKHQTSPASEVEERAVNDVALTTYGGAADTTMAVTSTFFYLMAKHPEVQKKAQAEIDQITGSMRLPTFEDRPALPYIEAIYREIMRWKQSLPLAAPHALTQDDYYKGYFIPKGTTVIGNVWAMTHDEDIYPDPHSFKPERFFDENGKLNKNDRILNYGFGRRVCVGKAVASSLVWFNIASSLACFDIGKDQDEFGNEIELNDEYYSAGFLTHKKDYKCSIAPRASIYKELIAEKNSRD